MYIDHLNCLIDLHLHLDGSLSLENVKQLSKIQNIEIPDTDQEILRLIRAPENCHSLQDFLKCFSFPCSLLQTKEGLYLATKNLLKELETQGLMYVEIRFAPQKSTDKGLSQQEAVEAVLEAVQEASLKSNLILCCMRDDSAHLENIETVFIARKYFNRGVCALDLAGDETLYSHEHLDEVFSLANDFHIPFTIHAGEACGPEKVEEALSAGASRIGHGIRSIEDQKVVSQLIEKHIPLEICPTSNLCCEIYDSINTYPVRELINQGVTVTINTDDMAIENTTLKDEYKLLMNALGFKKDEIRQLLINSANSAFVDEKTKEEMIQKIQCAFDEL